MPLPMIAFAAASFACASPWHHDGDNIRCAGADGTMRLYGIDAPEMPGSCRPGRRCTPGDPYAARDALRALTDGRRVTCEQLDTDNYGRPVVLCEAGGVDLSCAMIASGHAVPRYGTLDCGDAASRPAARDKRAAVDSAGPGRSETAAVDSYGPGRSDTPPPRRPEARRFVSPDAATTAVSAPASAEPAGPWLWIVLGWLVLVNISTWLQFGADKRLAQSVSFRVRRVPEATLLTLAALGGTPAAWAAIRHFRHKTRKQPFRSYLLLITALQIGLGAGAVLLLAAPEAVDGLLSRFR